MCIISSSTRHVLYIIWGTILRLPYGMLTASSHFYRLPNCTKATKFFVFYARCVGASITAVCGNAIRGMGRVGI